MGSHASILKHYWFSGGLILAYYYATDSHLTSLAHTEVFVDSRGTSFQYTNVLLILIYGTSFQHTDVLLIFMWPHSSILMCYWFSCDRIPAYWSIVDSYGTSFQHTNVLLILMPPHSSILILVWPRSSIIGFIDYDGTSYQHTKVFLILRLPNPGIQMCYWFLWYLIPAYWCVFDSHVTSSQHTNVFYSHGISFQHTDVSLIIIWPNSSILK